MLWAADLTRAFRAMPGDLGSCDGTADGVPRRRTPKKLKRLRETESTRGGSES